MEEQTALMTAILDIDLVAIARSLDRGADPNATTEGGLLLPIACAIDVEVDYVANGPLTQLELTMTTYLIARGADPFLKPRRDVMSGLEMAIVSHHWLALELFASLAAGRGVDVPAVGEQDRW